MKIKLTDEMIRTIQEHDNLKGYLSSLSSEKSATPRSWLYDGEHGNLSMEPDDILHTWCSKLEVLKSDANQHLNNVYQFDTAQVEKWGPQGGHKPIAELEDILEQGFMIEDSPKRTPGFRRPEWREAKRIVVKKLYRAGARSLRPASYESVVDDMRARDTLDSKSGWPLHIPRKEPEAKARAIEDAKSGEWRRQPAIALFRTYNKKTRLVWMYPMAVNLVEGAFFQPLQQVLMTSYLAESFFSPWKGFEQVRSRVTNTYRKGFMVAASDFSSTDAHFQKSTSLEVSDVLEQCFQPAYRAELRESITYMHEIPLVIGLEYMLVGSHGVSSGSNWTNFIETVFDMILGEYAHLLDNHVLALYGIGDDMAWASITRTGDEFKKWLEQLGTSVGQQIKAEKTTAERDQVKTLQRLFQRGYFQETGNLLRGVYSTIRALKSSVYPERYHKPEEWDGDMFSVRQFMILENCVDHPLFKEFVTFICKGNHHLIPFAKRSRGYLDAAQRRANHVHGLTSTYNQEKRDSALADFASIRIAANL